MVQMVSTFFDDALQRLSEVEEYTASVKGHLPLYRITRIWQSLLRLFRMFLWCTREIDADLLADLNSFATSLAQLYKSEGSYAELYSSVTEMRQISAEISKCHAEMTRYRQDLMFCSLKAEPFTIDETIGFLDSVYVASNDLLKCYVVEFLPITSHVETLQETVFLLRNLVYYSPMGGEYSDISSLSLSDFDANPQTNLNFQFNVHDWANKAACFFLSYFLIEREDEENSQEIRRLYIDLQQKVDPCNPEFIKLCFQNIRVPHMKGEDRLLFGEFVSRFVDFFLENLVLILNDDVRMVREGLILLITFLADPPANTVNHSELSSIREQIYAVLDEASDTICFFGETNMDLSRGKIILDDFQRSIDEVRAKISNIYVLVPVPVPHSSLSNFPRIDRLGYLECLLAYLENLKETMNKNKKLVPFLKTQIFTIQEELLPLRLFLQDTSTMQDEHNGFKDIWEQITSLLYQVDFAIKSSFFIDEAIWYNLTCLNFVIRKIKDIRFKIMNIQFETQTEGSHICRTEGILPLMNSIDVPKPPTSTSTVEVLVGFKKEIALLLDRLECGSSKLDIVSIVGMGGIGKTTLAKKLYNEPSVVHRFHKRAFCSVSQAYQKRNVLLDILRDISSIHGDHTSDEDLQHMLYQRLKGNRYLIVVDDIWDINVWNDLRASFPDDSNGSRVIFTTRINSISISTPCQLPFLSNDESWELLQQNIFHKNTCPPHLLKVGKLIAKNCKGLPLAIAVIAGLLARTEKNLLKWNEVADTLSSFASSEGCDDIIKLSYKHLPEALKSCFLYLGAFREDGIIEAKQLALLWVTEGFVLKSGSSSLHKIAKKYLNDLADRNLLSVTKRSCNGGVKCFRVHDLIRDFCMTKAQEEHYMCYFNAHIRNFPMSGGIYEYRININDSIGDEWKSLIDTKVRGPTVHSLLIFIRGYLPDSDLQSFLPNFKLVQVLDLQEMTIRGNFPIIVTTLVHLRYLALLLSKIVYVSPDIGNLWNLETLILSAGFSDDRHQVKFPNDIWKLKRLRYVESYDAEVALDDVAGVSSQLPDLETFTALYIPPGEDGDELLRRLSNVRKFSCTFTGRWDPNLECTQLPKLEILTKLESLIMENYGGFDCPYMFSFPPTIRKLTLKQFYLPWNEFSAIIGMLPCLEVLVLQYASFRGKTWNAEDEEFPNIKSLTLENLDIEEWIASIDSFPSLEKLVLSWCSSLIEIPPCFSELATLNYIKVHSCKKRVANSAIKIQEDQLDSGNESFEVDILK